MPTRSGAGRASRPDQGEYLVALLLHQLLRARFEVEPQQRLRVRGPHVEVPVVRVDGDAVEMGDGSFRRVALLQLLQLEGDIRDGRVQLAGDEVRRPEGG